MCELREVWGRRPQGARLQAQVAQALERREGRHAGVRERGAVLQVQRAQRAYSGDRAAAGVADARRVLQAQLRQPRHAAPAGKALACARHNKNTVSIRYTCAAGLVQKPWTLAHAPAMSLRHTGQT